MEGGTTLTISIYAGDILDAVKFTHLSTGTSVTQSLERSTSDRSVGRSEIYTTTMPPGSALGIDAQSNRTTITVECLEDGENLRGIFFSYMYYGT